MESRRNGKLKILYIIDILKKHSDEEHPLSAAEICDYLADYDISAERKAIYDDIENLMYYGFDIIKTRSPKPGVFLASRDFEIPEIYLLTDAVQSADFITPKKTRELVSKLDSMLSEEQARLRQHSTYIEYNHKCNNEEIYITIDSIRRAVELGHKITLRYISHHFSDGRKIETKDRRFKVSPYALIWTDDHYYLVCNNEKYDNLMHLRLDRMKSVTETDEPSRHFSECSSYTTVFDTADYISKAFNMFGGEQTEIELRCSESILEQIIDRFSENIHITDKSDGKFNFRTKALVSDGLVSWLMQFGGDIEVISPPSIRKMIKEKIEEVANLY